MDIIGKLMFVYRVTMRRREAWWSHMGVIWTSRCAHADTPSMPTCFWASARWYGNAPSSRGAVRSISARFRRLEGKQKLGTWWDVELLFQQCRLRLWAKKKKTKQRQKSKKLLHTNMHNKCRMCWKQSYRYVTQFGSGVQRADTGYRSP